MKATIRLWFFCLTILCVFFSAYSFAAMLYVKPSSEITMRRGQGTEFKIIAVIKDGTPVDLLEEVNDWAQIRLESGKEGWVLRRYLSETPPLGEQLEILQREKEVLTQTSQSLRKRVDLLTAEKDQIEGQLSSEKTQVAEQLDQCVTELTEVNDDFLTLQKDTADVVKTKKDLASAQSAIAELEQRVKVLREDNQRLSKTETLKWFLAGGGVFFFGWIIGLISRRSRKKRSSLL